MSKEIKLIPELRFPEFEEQDGWVLNNVNSLFSLQDGYAFSSRIFTAKAENTSQVIRITDINNHNRNSEKVFIPKEKIADLRIDNYLVKRGDLLLSLTGAAGFNFYIWDSDDAYINQRTMKITPKDSKNEPLKILLSPLIQEIINGIGTGQNNNLSKDALKEVELPIPKPKEQQKIASCLSSLDELLAAHNDKLDALKDHKRGLMQNLFPQEGETVPKVRFKEFEDDGEWEAETLVKLARFRRGSFPQPYGLAKWYDDENGMPFIQVYDVDDNFRLKSTTKRKISSLAGEQSVFIEKGTVIITIQGSIGRVAITQYDAYIDRTLLIFQEFNTDIDKSFFAYVLFLLFEIEKQKAPGGIIKTITKEVLSDFLIKMPSKEEQQKIASCLSAVDELIKAQADKIEQLQQHKKGLMQGLFPKIES